MSKNTVRFDLSDYLIHFFRKIDIDGPNSPSVPEHFGFGNINEDTSWSALFMLRCAIRLNRLWATWSYRNGIRTIYGPSPAVCFTEMPLAAFLEAGSIREARGEAMSQFALVFPKRGMYVKGANPVIYGLDIRSATIPSGKGGGVRIINTDLLPEREQYRYVTYNPSSTKPIDWTHEREWRWPFRGDLAEYEQELSEFGLITDASAMPALDLSPDELRGMGVIVQTTEQAKCIANDILSLVDRKILPSRHYSFILCTSKLKDPTNLRDPEAVSQAIQEAMIDLAPYFIADKTRDDSIHAKFSALVVAAEKSAKSIEEGEFGGAWLWIIDNTHELTRSLIASGRITVSSDSRYLAYLWEFDDRRGLQQREEMIRKLAVDVEKVFGVECGYFSVLNSDDVNAVPFYCDDHLDNRMFYNVSWE